MAENFQSLTKDPYFIDKTQNLKILFSQTNYNNLLTYPRGWGKTTNMRMIERFTSIRRDPSGKEIINISFEEFSDKRVVMEDVVEVRDIAFLYKNIEQIKGREMIFKSEYEVLDYFRKRNYPWFLMSRNCKKEKQSVIMRIYDIVSKALPNEEEYKNKTEEELKQILEEIIEKYKNSQKKDDKDHYFNILSHFGQTCKHFAKYPVIYMTLPEIGKVPEYKSELIILQSIKSLYNNHSYLRDSYQDSITNPNVESYIKYEAQDNLDMFNKYLQLELPLDRSLLFLSELLFKLTQVPAIILIDEYDRPMHSTMKIGDRQYDEVKNMIGFFLRNSLKNNPNIARSYTTGVTRLSKDGGFGSLNNLMEYSLKDKILSTCFGFTYDDVKYLIDKYYTINPPPKINTSLDKAEQDIILKNIKEATYNKLKFWYFQCRIEDIDLFNSFSVKSCLRNNLQYESYLINSRTTDILLESFKNLNDKEETLNLLQQETIKFSLDYYLYWQGMKKIDSYFLLNLLFQLGFLTLAPAEDQSQCRQYEYLSFVIPNEELRRELYECLFSAFFQITYCPQIEEKIIQSLVQSITSPEFPSLLEQFINESAEIDLSKKEKSYQGLIEATFRLSQCSKYVFQSEKMMNKKSDDFTVFISKSESNSSIIFLKYKLVQESSHVQESLENALWQIFSLGFGKILLKDLESWESAIIRTMVFLPEQDPSRLKKWKINIFSFENIFSRQQLQSAADLFQNEQNSKVTYQFLLGKGEKGEAKKERKKFLTSKYVKEFNALLKVPCITHEKGKYRFSAMNNLGADLIFQNNQYLQFIQKQTRETQQMSKEKGIKRAYSKVNNNIKGQITKITSFFHCEEVIRSSSRPSFFTKGLIDEDEKQQFKQLMFEDQMLKEMMQRSLDKNVKEYESDNGFYVSDREQYVENQEGEQEQRFENQKKKQQLKNRKEEEDLIEKNIQSQLAGILSENEDETESDNEQQNEKLIPKEIYCFPQTEIQSWECKNKILKELSDKKHINRYSGYVQIYYLYRCSNDRVNLDSLKNYIDDRLKEPERVDFFSNLLPFIAQLALEIQNIALIPFLIPSREAGVIFTRKQIACLLAGMFLGVLLPQQNDLSSESSFRKMLAGSLNYKNNSRKIEKISCIVHYFKRIQAAMKEQLNEEVQFQRLVFDPQLHKSSNFSVFWSQSQKQLSEVILSKESQIEDFDETIQVDFSNEYIGGGVLDHGLEQEEIRFLVSPELIISLLICPKIEDHEAILIVGSEQFCSYEGYGDTFKFSGDIVQKQIYTNTQGFRKSAVLAIDAINYSQSYDKKIQYKMHTIVRELLKSYVGFECSKQLQFMEGQSKMRICTGRWGCGNFGGDPQLKFLIQWMSASEAERGMIFCSLNDQELSEIEKVVGLLKNMKVNEVFTMIYKYTDQVNQSNKEQTLFQFVEKYCGK